MDTGLADLEFGRFRVLTRQRQLLADGAPVELGTRAFDVLMVLIEAQGALVSKDRLLDRVWPGTVVEENNIQVQISALRRAFGEDRNLILTVPLRGYRFTGALRAVTALVEGAAPNPATAPALLTNLPSAVSEFIGRGTELEELAELLGRHRLVTIVGTGGIGKTRLAVELALSRLADFPDGVWRAQLAPLTDPALVANVTTTALGLDGGAAQWPPERRAVALRGKRLLLVLDNCEHLAGAAASEAELLLHAVPTLQLLATSQEPLGVDGECVYRLQPFAVSEDNCRECAEALKNDAVRLFLARARAADPHFTVDETEASLVATICRRLDGIPLGIELAAARAATLGIAELARRLDDRFRLLTGGSRTALPRHQTLRATLDWSHRLLSEAAQRVLRRLAVFSGRFTLAAAARVVADDARPEWEVVDHIAELVNHSLVMTENGGPERRYRLLETTRAYAREKLADSGEFALISRRHAQSLADLFPEAHAAWETITDVEWAERYVPELDNIRAALDWAFGPDGDAALGLRLAAISFILWPLAALVLEGRARLEHAIAHLGPTSDKATEALLWYGYGFLNIGTPRARAIPAFERSVALYRELGDRVWLGRALSQFGLHLVRTGAMEQGQSALEEAQALLAATSSGSKSYAHALMHLGIAAIVARDYATARTRLDETLTLGAALGADYWVFRARLFKAELDYAEGDCARAIAAAREVVAFCRAMRGASSMLGHALCSLGEFLVADGAVEEARAALREGLPLALAGDLGAALLATGVQSAAAIALTDGRIERAAQLIGYADAFFTSEYGTPHPHPGKLARRNEVIARLEAALPPERLVQLKDEGARLGEDEVLAAALEP